MVKKAVVKVGVGRGSAKVGTLPVGTCVALRDSLSMPFVVRTVALPRCKWLPSALSLTEPIALSQERHCAGGGREPGAVRARLGFAPLERWSNAPRGCADGRKE